MGKLLRVLVVFFLLLSIGALVLAILLFNKREILKGRTQQLENTIIALGPFIEAEKAEPQENAFAPRDISKVEAQVLETPEQSDFWKKYQQHLEKPGLPKLDIKARQTDLMQYYKIDPATLKPERDAMGYKVTTGQGTMDAVLKDVLAKAAEQLAALDTTRQQLVVTREELVSTIEDLNTRKGELRQSLVNINDLNGTVAKELEEEGRQKDAQISDLQAAQQKLEQQVADQTAEIEKQKDEIAEREQYIEKQRKQIVELIELTKRPADAGLQTYEGRMKMEPGRKGTVVEVNSEWRFVVVELAPEFLAEVGSQMTRAEGRGGIAPVDLYVKRGGEPGVFVAKIRLTQVRVEQKLGIADVLTDWEKLPLQKGDVVYY